MPECKFGLNKLVIEQETNQNRRNGVEIDDCTFHRCVRLGKFDADRTITFIPPDGEFELMRYRVTDNINLPFRVIPAVQEETGQNRVSMNLKVIANFSEKLFATHVVIKIPVPKNTAKAKIDLIPTVRNKVWNRQPINLEFQVPMFTASGVHVRFLRVYDKSGYHTNRWVRYITKAGGYSVRS